MNDTNQARRHVFVVDRHYAPDSNPLATFWETIVGWLVEDDCTVSVITSQPGYRQENASKSMPWRETGGDVRLSIIRVPLLPDRWHAKMRYVNYILFSGLIIPLLLILNLRHLATKRVVMTSTVPPVILAACAWLVSAVTRAKFLYYVQDIHPEAAIKPGAQPGIIAKVALVIDRFVVGRSWKVVSIAKDMEDTLRNRGGRWGSGQIIENFSLIPFDPQARAVVVAERLARAQSNRFLFAGNIGRFQNLDALVDAFLHHDVGDASLTLVGSGVWQPHLKDKVEAADASAGAKVQFKPYVDKEQMPAVFAQYDFGIATLQPHLIRYAYPSKIATYLEFGLPVLTTVETDSQLSRKLSETSCGINVRPTGDEIAAGVRSLIAERKRYMSAVSGYKPEAALQAARDAWKSIIFAND